MAENVQFQSEAPATPPDTAVIAADDIDGVKYQRMKLVTGSDGQLLGDVSTHYPLPVRDYISQEILFELRRMNSYLSLIVGHELDDDDVT